MVRLALRLLGVPRLTGERGTPITVPVGKPWALLGYLGCAPGRLATREHLATLLWSDRTDEYARASLRQCLLTLRRSIGPRHRRVLTASREQVGLCADEVESDVARFESLAASHSSEELELASRLYSGELLEGLAVPSTEYEHWLEHERNRLKARVCEVLSALALHYMANDLAHLTHETLARWLVVDPLAESAHRQLMVLRFEQGDRVGALRQYRECEQLLRRDLGVGVSPETVALWEKIAQGGGEPDAIRASRDPWTATVAVSNDPTVMVFPFSNASEDSEQQHFVDGVTEDVITGLTRFHGLAVIAAESTFLALKRHDDPLHTAHQLGVEYVVTGSVRRAHDHLRITAHLIQTAGGRHLWGNRYDCSLEEIFQVQDQMTDAIVATVVGRIENEARMRRSYESGKSVLVHEHLLRGRQCLNLHTKSGSLEARGHFQRALDVHPECAAAFAGLAVSHLNEHGWSISSSALESALSYSERALELDSDDTTARYVLANVLCFMKEHDLARAQIDKMLAVNPNDYHLLCTKSWLLAFTGQPEESILCSQSAMRLNPFAPDDCFLAMGIAEYSARHYEAAIEAFSKMSRVRLQKPACLAASFAWLGRKQQAQAAAREAVALAPLRQDCDVSAWHVYWNGMFPFERSSDLEHVLEGLRLSGLPV